MVSGTDEHGTPVMVAADREGKSYVEVADYYNQSFREDFRRLGLSYDLFSRTTTLNHERVVQDLFRTLYEHGAIVERDDARLVLAGDRATRSPTATSRARARSAATRRRAATSATTAATSSTRPT